jgi:hypothetical protein
VSPLLRRNRSAPAVEESPAAEPADAQPRGRGAKGRPTPKRNEQVVRRTGPPPPPPRTRKEAYARVRAKQRADRGKTRAGIAAGDDSYFMERDRGPVRALVRDIVDSRRNAGSWFFAIGLFVILANSVRGVPFVQFLALFLWVLLIAVLVLDWFLLHRKISRLVGERYPEDTTPMRKHVIYGILRSMQFRRLRQPSARVRLRERI